jgi:hypothetical protein
MNPIFSLLTPPHVFIRQANKTPSEKIDILNTKITNNKKVQFPINLKNKSFANVKTINTFARTKKRGFNLFVLFNR